MLLLLLGLIPVEARRPDEAERHLGRPGQVVVGVHHTSATKGKVIIRRASNKIRLSFGGTLVKTGQKVQTYYQVRGSKSQNVKYGRTN